MVAAIICQPGAFTPTIKEESVQCDDTRFARHLKFTVEDEARLTCDLRLVATDNGEVQAGLTMKTPGRRFATNRDGFPLLPLRSLAGAEPVPRRRSARTGHQPRR